MRLAKAYPRAWRFPAYRRSKQEVETSGEREKAEGRERRGSYDPLKTSLFEPARHVDDVGCSRHFECNSTNAVHFMTANFLLFSFDSCWWTIEHAEDSVLVKVFCQKSQKIQLPLYTADLYKVLVVVIVSDLRRRITQSTDYYDYYYFIYCPR